MSKNNGAIPARGEVDAAYQWKPEHIFASEELFHAALGKMRKKAEEISAFKGTLGQEKQLQQAIAVYEATMEQMKNAMVYANCHADVDKRDAKYQSLVAKVNALYVEVSAACAFFDPEVAALGGKALELVQGTPYVRFVSEILRQAKHTLSEKEEYLLSLSGEVCEAPERAYSMLENADLQFGTVMGEDGNPVEITNGRFVHLLESKDRRVRQETFATYYGVFAKHKNTFASLLNSHHLKNKFIKTARSYDSCLEMCLSPGEIPTSVYHNLIAAVEEGLPTFYEYVRLRRELLGVEELHMYDLYTPLVENTFADLSYKSAQELVLEALAPLGEEYQALVKRAYAEGWIDVYESQGKTSGAYSNGSATCHPFVLLNHMDNLDSAFTLAHELGHAMHSHFSNHTQTGVDSGYSIFVAEVASTVNEALLNHYLIQKTKDPAKLKYVYNHYLESFRGTLFRQTMFAEFELLTHLVVEEGDGLTPDFLCDEYEKLVEKYFGKGQVEGLVLDEEIRLEWARIPHFYYDFYVYQYATGFAAAQAIAAQILADGKVENYLRFLSAGSSLSPLDALRLAGVDLTTSAPIAAAISQFGKTVEKLRELTATA